MTTDNLTAAGVLSQKGSALPNDNADLVSALRPEQARRFLQLLGKDPEACWFRTIRHGKGANSSRKGADLQGLDLAALTRDNRAGDAVYLVVGDALQASGKGVKDADITTVPALFVEWDDMPLEWQVNAWQTLGLPEPSVMVASGGKSLHCYWLMVEPLEPVEWRRITARLIAHCNSDSNCSNPSRVMRLPGFAYIDKATGKPTGTIAEIIHESNHRYSAAEIEACLPAPQQQQTIPTPSSEKATSRCGRDDYPAHTIEQIQEAAQYIPQRRPGSGDQDHYAECRNALSGCAAALAAIGRPEEQALDLLASKWPDRATAAQILDSTTTRNEASFWAIAQAYGYRHASTAADALDGFQVIAGGFDLKAYQSASSAPTTPPAASFQALIQLLPDGWNEKGRQQSLAPGQLAELLPMHCLRFNEMDLRAEVHTSSGWQRITDACLDSAYVLLTGKGWRIAAESVVKAVLHVARQSPHHPIRDYLQQIEADPTITPFDLDQVAPRFFRATNALHVAMIRKWLIGAVARTLKPGCQMDYCLVLKGSQGQRKSRSLEALASKEWHCSSVPESEKDLLLNAHSTWIYELAELESVTSRKEAGRMKNLITTSVDNLRPPYGRTTERLPRQSVFAATVNAETFLRDDTGNRRFWVVPVEGTEALDRDGIAAARDAIWKAAVIAFRSEELPMLPPAMEALSAAQNEDFNEQDAWVEMVLAWMDGDPMARFDPDRDPSTLRYDPDQPFTSAEVLYSAGLKRPEQITRSDENRIAVVLRRLGFTQLKQQRVGGRRVRRWSPSQPSQPSQPPGSEVVTPQDACAAVDLATPSQPSQPFSGKEGKESSGQRNGGAHNDRTFSNRGCDTPLHPPKSTALQAVQLSQPPAPEVVTAARFAVGELVEPGAEAGCMKGLYEVVELDGDRVVLSGPQGQTHPGLVIVPANTCEVVF